MSFSVTYASKTMSGYEEFRSIGQDRPTKWLSRAIGYNQQGVSQTRLLTDSVDKRKRRTKARASVHAFFTKLPTYFNRER